MEANQNKNILDRINESISQSVTFKLISIGILILLLLIPKSMINDLILEREQRMHETVSEITNMWSGSQTVAGPVLTVPYKIYYESEDKKSLTEAIREATFLPDELDIRSTVVPEERYRGIFKVIVYKTQLRLTGKFSKPDFTAWGIEDKDIMWHKAVLNIGISDLRGIEQQVELSFQNSKLPFQPGTIQTRLFDSGIHLTLFDDSESFYANQFNIEIPLKGSEELYFLPLGKNTEVTMTSSWADPGFVGAFPTKDSEISKDGFTATWKVLHFNRNYPQSWIDSKYYIDDSELGDNPFAVTANEQYAQKGRGTNIANSRFGVKLIVAADHYQKSMRTSKYSILIISLSFLIFFLIEVTQKYRIHAFQYILIGLTLLVFYTLLLSISEHLGFNPAYWISCLSVTVLISLYSKSVLGNRKMAVWLAGSLTAIYGFIFVIIQLETYALLVGSIGLFFILGLTMYITRKIKWNKTGNQN